MHEMNFAISSSVHAQRDLAFQIPVSFCSVLNFTPRAKISPKISDLAPKVTQNLRRPGKRPRPKLSALVTTQSDTALIEIEKNEGLTKKKKIASIRKHKQKHKM